MGCGACKWVCPNDAISLQNIPEKGIRPFVDENKCEKCGDCVAVCPGKMLEHKPFPEDVIQELADGWGPILEIYEGHAADNNIRYRASSGGIATALALYAVEKAGFAGVLHVKVDPHNPIANIPVYSTSREDILAASGSRYAPAAPCQDFNKIKQANGLSMFIGKPCDCAALRKASEMDNELANKVGLIVSIFCAGTPTTNGTLSILKEMGINNQSDLTSFRYRGHGWPGMATACGKAEKFDNPQSDEVKIDENGCRQMTYEDTWGNILTKHVQLRCRLCPDSTGEFADISIGDSWYRINKNDTGRSLIIIRTKTGLSFFIQDIYKYIKYEKAKINTLPNSQQSVYNRRCTLWGRLKIMELFLIPRPVFINFRLIKTWNNNPSKLKTFLGTLKRIIVKKWYTNDYYFNSRQ